MSVKYTNFLKYIEKWQKAACLHLYIILSILRSSLNFFNPVKRKRKLAFSNLFIYLFLMYVRLS